MRRGFSTWSTKGVRSIVGVAPVLNLGAPAPKKSTDAQIAQNTEVALELIRKFKGEVPAPYERRHNVQIDEIQKEVEQLLGGAGAIRRQVTDDQPMDKLTVIERCLRHAICNYWKDEGKYDFDQFKQWLVYTQQDEQMLNKLKRSADLKEKYTAFKARRAETGGAPGCVPKFDWTQEYKNVIDREIVAEKRFRYDVAAANTTERNEAKIEAVLKEYRKSAQDARLDKLVDMIERFKPVLAREAIMQRLTIKHLEGQLSMWRYMDWNPEVRDRCELESDCSALQWWHPNEEKRAAKIRLRSKDEVRAVMEAAQAKIAAEQAATGAVQASGDSGNASRDKLLAEVIRLQQRIGRAEETDEEKSDKSDSSENTEKSDREKEAALFNVDAKTVQEIGLLGLNFVKA